MLGQENVMVVCGMSGGVDSSVAAWLLHAEGLPVSGIFMNNWDDGDPQCRAPADRADALRVCGLLGIPFQVMDFQDHYRAQVFQAFLDGYARGITPNPDILCNREVKFGAFLDAVMATGADQLATGHYARIGHVDGKPVLLRALDRSKDQSYFLSSVSHRALAATRFPLGNFTKAQVRALARQAGLPTAAKPDSTGICFIGERDFRAFLSQYLPAQPGPIVDLRGRVLGQHTGALYYTVGQRLPVGGVRNAPPGPWFVCHKRVSDNTLVAAPGAQHPALFSTRITTLAPDWVARVAPGSSFSAQVQLQHRGLAHPAQVRVLDDGKTCVDFEQPVRAAAIGQQAVFYQAEVCLGGGQIDATSAPTECL